MKIWLMVVVMCGCVDPMDESVRLCRRDAEHACEVIGYPRSLTETCYRAFAQGCSPDDEQAARAECLRATPERAENGECRLQWR